MSNIKLMCAIVFIMSVQLCNAQSEEPTFNRDIRPILSGKCFHCHGPDAEGRKGDLRLDRFEDAIKDGAIVPGKPEDSFIMDHILAEDPDDLMPPKGGPLSSGDIEKLQSWIRAGAKYEKHWSYIPPQKAKKPKVKQQAWGKNVLDDFVLAKMEKQGFEPSKEASPALRLRRIALDLVGIAPSLKDLECIESDPSQKNYEKHIDRLLASEQYGEKWAVHWLDLARYADTNGYQHDDVRNIYPYRDWVIQALNQDMPFNQFTLEQLAGDLLEKPTNDQLIATGFHRNVATNFSGGAKVPEVRATILHNRVATTGTVWLGMTFECSQCHDHKFDAITQEEYFKLYAYFNQAIPEVAQKSDDMFKKYFTGREVIAYRSEKDKDKAKALLHEIEFVEEKLEEGKKVALTNQIEWEQVYLQKLKRKQGHPVNLLPKPARKAHRAILKQRMQRSEADLIAIEHLLFFDHPKTRPHLMKIESLRKELNVLAPASMVMQDEIEKQTTHLMIRGDYTTLGAVVHAGTPDALHPLDGTLPKNRLGLAKWLIDPENPLMARVTVNRIWAQLFGQGIVSTLDDFGMQGAPPTHPKLLDWLAVEFVEQGWSIKKLIKTIMLSSTYQQSSSASKDKIERDPHNKTYSRGSRFRLSAELVRDQLLNLSGRLVQKVGGPPVYPPQPAGLWDEIAGATDKVYPTSKGEDRYRRGLYTIWRRGNPYPSMMNFDASSRNACEVKRHLSNSPLQALTLLNDPAYVEMALAFSKKIERWEGSDRDRVILAFRNAVSRHPLDSEINILLDLYRMNDSWFAVAQAIFNLDETISKS